MVLSEYTAKNRLLETISGMQFMPFQHTFTVPLKHYIQTDEYRNPYLNMQTTMITSCIVT